MPSSKSSSSSSSSDGNVESSSNSMEAKEGNMNFLSNFAISAFTPGTKNMDIEV